VQRLQLSIDPDEPVVVDSRERRLVVFFAVDGDNPVGTAAMYRSGTYAWLGGGTTLPESRNRGVQKALIQSRIEHGLGNGVSTFAVETSEPVVGEPNISFDNLRKVGFRQAFHRKNFKF